MINKWQDQIMKALRTSIDSNELVGANLLVLKDGREICYHEDGFADREENKPIKRDTIFRLNSMTKPITAAAVMILMERGQLDLFEPVSKFLPGFKNQMVEVENNLVPIEREVTIWDLLSMTSGLVYDGNNRAGRETQALFKEIEARLLGVNPMSTVEAMNRLGQCVLAFHPGKSWQYGTSADVLGAVVEVVSGMQFGEFLHKEIFTPLNMTDTGFWVPAEKKNRLARPYEYDTNGELIPYYKHHLGTINTLDRIPAFESGGAGLVSTIDDYSKFANMLMNNGSLDGVKVLKPKTVKYLTSCTLDADHQRNMWPALGGFSYGNLMRVMTDCSRAVGLASPGEYGWDGWLGAYFCNCPQDKLTILFMQQRTNSGTTPIVRKLRNIILSSL